MSAGPSTRIATSNSAIVLEVLEKQTSIYSIVDQLPETNMEIKFSSSCSILNMESNDSLKTGLACLRKKKEKINAAVFFLFV